MINRTSIPIRCGVVFCLMAFFFIGCRSTTPTVTFYNMTPLDKLEIDNPEQTAMENMKIGIGPVQFPTFLDRPQIVTRSGASSFNLSEFHRWGGQLDQDFLRVMSEDLSILLSTNRVDIYPWGDQDDPDYKISFVVHQFDGQLNDSVLLNVTWTIRGQDSTTALHAKRSIIQQPVSGKGYDAFVSGHSQALAELSREIAEVVKSIKVKK